MGYSQAQAADALGVTRWTIENWDAGRDRLRGREQVPGYAVRVLMQTLADGRAPKDWPE